MSDFVNDNAPFGPVASEQITDKRLWEQLFDRENRVYSNLRSKDPAFVIGRRGAGKTAFLFATTTDGPTLNVKVNTSTAVAEIADVIRQTAATGTTLFTEHIAEVWDVALWHAVFAKIASEPSDRLPADDHRLETVRFYVEDLAGGRKMPLAPDAVLALFCKELVERARGEPQLARHPLMFRLGDTHLSDVIRDTDSLLSDARREPVLLMDSMEDFQDVLDHHTTTFEGLFMQIGRSGQPAAPYRIRFSFPAELLNVMRSMSRNPLKDFGKNIHLQWSAAEIVKIAAHRFHLFLRERHPDYLDGRPDLKTLDTNDRSDALTLLNAVLPDSVSGEIGISEDAIAYVLRHTQLLPRHLLRLLNAVCDQNSTNGEPPTRITEAAVVEGIRVIETDIVSEICKAYELVHPLADEVCRAVIKHLPRRFTNSELHRAFNRHGKAALVRGYKRLLDRRQFGPQGLGAIDHAMTDMDYFDFRAMLGEIGCIGRVIKETDRYDIGYFEYAIPGRLALGDDDDFCIHPLFSGVYQARSDDSGRLVYPYGSDPSEDHRTTSPPSG